MSVIAGMHGAVMGLVGFALTLAVDAPVVVVVPAFAAVGPVIGSIGAFVARSRWPEGEVLAPVERMAILRVIADGTDVGVDDLAAATARRAGLLRESVERTLSSPSRAIAVLAAVIDVTLGVMNVVSGSTALGAMWLGLGAVEVFFFRRAGQKLPMRRTNAWNAEWYAAQRLAGNV